MNTNSNKTTNKTETQKQPISKGVFVQENNECDGVEIYFPNKPERETINEMKKHKFRYHHKKVMWYAKRSEDTITFAKSLVG